MGPFMGPFVFEGSQTIYENYLDIPSRLNESAFIQKLKFKTEDTIEEVLKT